MTKLKKKLFLLAFAFYGGLCAAIEPTRLTCTLTSEPVGRTFQVEIELDSREVMLGDYFYDIVQVNERYLTAVLRPDGVGVGAESLVLDRINGRMERAAVYIAATLETLLNPESHSLSNGLIAKTYSAHCRKTVL